MNDAHLFAAARDSMMKADYNGASRVRIGCVIAYKKAILAKGFNSDKTHTEQARFNKWRYKDAGNNYLPAKVHSELSALNKIKFLDIDFSKVHIYIYRELRDGTTAMCRPCPACMAAIKEMGIKHIHYTTSDGIVHEVIGEIND